MHNYVKQHGESVVERHRSQSRAPSTSDAQAVGHGNSNSSSSIPSTANLVDNALPPASNNAAPASPEGQPAALRLTIRGGPDQKVGLAVPITKTVLSVIKAFLRKFSIDQDKAGQCKLLFDGEELEHGTQLKDTEVEDEDTLDVKVPA